MKILQRDCYILLIILAVIIVALVGAYYLYQHTQSGKATALIESKANMPYIGNIIKEAEDNTDFRKVLFTGTRSQLVVMSVPPGGEAGEETHTYTEQTIFFLSGTGKIYMDDREIPISAGSVFVVTPGTGHNVINTGTVPLKLYTVYAPPNHIDGTVEATKAGADSNAQDEAYGQQVK